MKALLTTIGLLAALALPSSAELHSKAAATSQPVQPANGYEGIANKQTAVKKGVVSISRRSRISSASQDGKRANLSIELRNDTNQSVRFVKVFYQFQPYFSKSVYTGDFFIDPMEAPIQKGSRVTQTETIFLTQDQADKADGKLKITRLEWMWEDGSISYSIPVNP
ncbi:MAG: hypothetical protein HC772_16610 [Leptolyngbyaceae cyanobacterium CRU_2_3]|nr:hypothetical protein [Leptolyngbyaceae cyanobacterium CRU_2_3]